MAKKHGFVGSFFKFLFYWGLWSFIIPSLILWFSENSDYQIMENAPIARWGLVQHFFGAICCQISTTKPGVWKPLCYLINFFFKITLKTPPCDMLQHISDTHGLHFSYKHQVLKCKHHQFLFTQEQSGSIVTMIDYGSFIFIIRRGYLDSSNLTNGLVVHKQLVVFLKDFFEIFFRGPIYDILKEKELRCKSFAIKKTLIQKKSWIF